MTSDMHALGRAEVLLVPDASKSVNGEYLPAHALLWRVGYLSPPLRLSHINAIWATAYLCQFSLCLVCIKSMLMRGTVKGDTCSESLRTPMTRKRRPLPSD